MKKWLPIIVAFGILIGFGVLLITTRQTSIVPPSTEIEALNPNSESLNPSDLEKEKKSEPNTVAQSVGPTIGNQGNAVDPKQHLTLEEFKVLAQQISKSLPTKQDLQKISPEDAHLTPSPILLAGERLGQIAQAVYNEPALGEEAMIFYLDCANAPMYPDSVRALCYSNYKALAKKLGRTIQENTVPAAIRKLADKLQGI